MFSISEVSAVLIQPLFSSTRKGTETFIISSNEKTSNDRKKKKERNARAAWPQSCVGVCVCVCVCVCVTCIYTYTSLIQNGALLRSGSILTLSKLTKEKLPELQLMRKNSKSSCTRLRSLIIEHSIYSWILEKHISKKQRLFHYADF